MISVHGTRITHLMHRDHENPRPARRQGLKYAGIGLGRQQRADDTTGAAR
jgi:hypothetical protein